MTGDTTRQLLAPYALPPERQIVVEPGTDRVAIDSDTSALGLLSGEAARPSDRAPRRTVVGTHPVELLCVATVNALKGHELLLEALASLTSRAWHLTCAGSLTRDAATAARVRGFIAHHGLDDHVTLTGELDEVAVDAAYRRADIFVLATRQDTYGMAVAEAIAHGLPVVATDTGAIAAIIGPDAGIVVPVDDVRSLATALGRIIDEAPLRASLAAGACRARRRLPTWDAAVDRLAAALEPLAHG
jgi:glycosyltransferase involved in cell wall biosynthesis